MQHVIYIPGLGDRMGGIRSMGLVFWKSADTKVTLVPMRWMATGDSYEQKLARIDEAIGRYPSHEVVLAGESAGGAMALVAMRRFKTSITRIVTICGMNQGADSVSPRLYGRNRGFRETMEEADVVVSSLTDEERERMFTIYSSRDNIIRPKHTLIQGVRSHDLKVPIHHLAILSVLYFSWRLVTEKE